MAGEIAALDSIRLSMPGACRELRLRSSEFVLGTPTAQRGAFTFESGTTIV